MESNAGDPAFFGPYTGYTQQPLYHAGLQIPLQSVQQPYAYHITPMTSSLLPPPQQPQLKIIEPQDVTLVIRQQPREALVTAAGKEKARKPVDPPPIVQLHLNPDADPAQHYMQSPYLFMTCSLLEEDGRNPAVGPESTNGKKEATMTGSLTSSLHRLKDGGQNDREGAFFVFGDVSIRVTGKYRLRFSLYDVRKNPDPAAAGEVVFLGDVTSEPFTVVLQKDFRGMEESTMLSRNFSDQGVRLRLRKEPRGFSSGKRTFGSFSGQGGYGHEELESPPGPSHIKHDGLNPEYGRDMKRPRTQQPGQGFFDGLATQPLPSGSMYGDVANSLAVRPPDTSYSPYHPYTSTALDYPPLPLSVTSTDTPYQYTDPELHSALPNLLPTLPSAPRPGNGSTNPASFANSTGSLPYRDGNSSIPDPFGNGNINPGGGF